MTKDTFDVPADMKTYMFNTRATLQRSILDELFAAITKNGLRISEDALVAVTQEELTFLQECATKEDEEGRV